jgi:hypothetical protein
MAPVLAGAFLQGRARLFRVRPPMQIPRRRITGTACLAFQSAVGSECPSLGSCYGLPEINSRYSHATYEARFPTQAGARLKPAPVPAASADRDVNGLAGPPGPDACRGEPFRPATMPGMW